MRLEAFEEIADGIEQLNEKQDLDQAIVIGEDLTDDLELLCLFHHTLTTYGTNDQTIAILNQQWQTSFGTTLPVEANRCTSVALESVFTKIKEYLVALWEWIVGLVKKIKNFFFGDRKKEEQEVLIQKQHAQTLQDLRREEQAQHQRNCDYFNAEQVRLAEEEARRQHEQQTHHHHAQAFEKLYRYEQVQERLNQTRAMKVYQLADIEHGYVEFKAIIECSTAIAQAMITCGQDHNFTKFAQIWERPPITVVCHKLGINTDLASRTAQQKPPLERLFGQSKVEFAKSDWNEHKISRLIDMHKQLLVIKQTNRVVIEKALATAEHQIADFVHRIDQHKGTIPNELTDTRKEAHLLSTTCHRLLMLKEVSDRIGSEIFKELRVLYNIAIKNGRCILSITKSAAQ